MTTLQEIKESLARLEGIQRLAVKRVFTQEEAALFLGISRAYLYKLTSDRKVPYYKRGKTIYFLKEELEDWMLERKLKAEDEIEREAGRYLFRKDAQEGKLFKK